MLDIVLAEPIGAGAEAGCVSSAEPLKAVIVQSRRNTPQMRFSIITVAWNCWPHIFRCLDALEAQTRKDFDVLIIDNGNATLTDLDRLKAYSAVRYQKSPSNLGFAAGNNRGLELLPDAQWIALLNPDTIPAPRWFATMVQATETHPNCAVFGAKLVQADNPSLLDGRGDSYHVSGFASRLGLGLPDTLRGEAVEEFSPCAAAAFYRADVLRSLGGFDEDFFCYLEDVDLGFRLRLAGHHCLIVPDAAVTHVGSATSGKRSPFYVYYGQRNLVWAYVKNMPGILFWAFLPLHLVLNMAGVLRYAGGGQLGTVLRAKRDAILGLPRIWKKRQAIQMRRTAGTWDILASLDKRPLPGLDRALSSLWK